MIDDEYMKVDSCNTDGMRNFDPLEEDVAFYGAPWIKENQNYERLPASNELLKKASLKCFNLGKCSSGIQLHFRTNTKKLIIHAYVPNTSCLSGMTWVAQAGFDCYMGTSYDDLKFIDTSRCYPIVQKYEYTFFSDLPGDKLIVINFPLYNEVKGLYFSIDNDAYLKRPEPLPNKGKIVCYGTSITMGGCASRPGLAYTNILSRSLKQEIINFGFSGNAFGEKEYADILPEVKDVSLYIINYEANGGTNGLLEKTLETFIETIRKKDPYTPIIVGSRIIYMFDVLKPDTLGKNRERIRKFQEDLVKKLQVNDQHLYYLNGLTLLGEDYDELTIDAIHPNDLGFMKIAKNMKAFIEDVFKIEGVKNGKTYR